MDGNIRLNPTFQNYFSSLTSGNCHKRIESSEHLLKFLVQDAKKESKSDDSLQYSLTRLVRGLSSSKQQARVGFATALTNILRQFQQVTIHQINLLVQETLKVDPRDSRKEVSNVLLGQLLVYMSVIQSDRIREATNAELTQIVKRLKYIAKKKQPLENVVTQSINQLISKVSADQFRAVVLEQLKEDLTRGWEDCDADTLSLLLTARKTHKDVIDSKFLKQYWGSKKILSENNFNRLANIIASCVKSHPLVHPVCEQLLKYEPKKVNEVWQQIYETCLLVPDARRSFLCMSLVPTALRLCSSSDQIRAVLSPRLVAMVLKQLSAGKDAILAAAVKKLCHELGQFCESCEDGELQVAVVTSIVSTEGGLQFDQRAKVNTLTKIATTLTFEGSKKLAQFCLDVVLGKVRFEYLPDDSLVGKRWACQYLPQCVSRMAGNQEGQLYVLRFLLLHGYFSQTSTKEGLQHCEESVFERSSGVQQLMRQTYHKALSRVAVAGTAERTRSKKHFIEVLYQLAQYAQSLLSSAGTVTADNTWDEDIMNSWAQSLQFIEKVRNAEPSKSTEAFQLLMLHLSLHLLEDPSPATADSLLDVQVCYVKAHKDKNDSTPKKKKRRTEVVAEEGEGEDEPAWMEVLVELLLSLLAQESHLLRTIVSSVFRMLSDSLTPGTVTLLIEALQSSGDDNLAFEDSEEEMEQDDDKEGSEEEEKSDEEEEEKNDEDEEEEEEDESSEEEDITVDTVLKKSLKAALGKAAVDSDEESESGDEDDDELGDEEMMKLDDQLAAAFRAMRKGKKDDQEKKKQLVNFKIRVLTLIVEMDTAVIAPSLLLPMLKPLVEIIEDAMKEKNMEEFEKKAVLAYNTICKIKANPTHPVNVDETAEKLQELVELSLKLITMQSVQRVASGCLLLVRLMMATTGSTLADVVKGTQDSKVTAVTTKIQQWLKDLLAKFSQKDQAKASMLLSTMVQKQPELLWPILDDMLELAAADSTRVFAKTKLLEIMTSLLNKAMNTLVGKESMQEATCKVAPLVKKLSAWQMSLPQPNSKLVCGMLTLAYQAVHFSSTDVLQSQFNLTEELVELRAKISSQDVRKQSNRLAALLQSRAGLKVVFKLPPKQQKASQPKQDKEDSDSDEEAEPPAKKKRGNDEENNDEGSDSEEEMEVQEQSGEKEKKEGQKDGLASDKRKKANQKRRNKKKQQAKKDTEELTNGTEPKKEKKKKKKSAVNGKE